MKILTFITVGERIAEIAFGTPAGGAMIGGLTFGVRRARIADGARFYAFTIHADVGERTLVVTLAAGRLFRLLCKTNAYKYYSLADSQSPQT